LVLIDSDKCIGCRFCISACPYEARYFDESRGVVDKCSACVHRLDAGQSPACVETCVGGSRHFGDLNDPNSTVAKLYATGRARPFHPETGTGPKIFYISAREQTDAEFPVNENVSSLVWFRRDLERPAALGLLGAAIALTGGAFRYARQNALKHFRQVETETQEAKEAAQKEPVDGESHVGK
jgi:nitrate reductase beta subunit